MQIETYKLTLNPFEIRLNPEMKGEENFSFR